MKALLPGAVFIGFTGTPLLKKDKATSLEVFGGYIHTYKFGEAVEDEVVLDLVYEARDIPQRLDSEYEVDAWFEAKTRELNDWQKAALREQWGTMQKVLSSRSRMERVVQNIVFDFGTKGRLITERGNAMLVASSIYEAAKYFELFQRTAFKGKCAVVTSYNPQAKDVTLEETGANTETEKQFLYNTYKALLKDVVAQPGKTQTETYEDEVKKLFQEQPRICGSSLSSINCSPVSTLHLALIFISTSRCRTTACSRRSRANRLDGEDKEFGYIVDYKDLFKRCRARCQSTHPNWTTARSSASPEVLLQDRLKAGRERLEEAREAIALLCEPVQLPKGVLEHIHFFLRQYRDSGRPSGGAPRRVALYTGTAALMRSLCQHRQRSARGGLFKHRDCSSQARGERHTQASDTIRQAS